MQSVPVFDWPGEMVTLAPGSVLLQRGAMSTHIYHVDEGRVSLGLLTDGALAHSMGLVQGPCWLNVPCAVLGVAPVIDAVTDSVVRARRVPLARFDTALRALPEPVRQLLSDVALAHRQQIELAVSRLAKDAEARCAEWLLQHAEPARETASELVVMLRQRKRLIAAQLGIAPETLSRVLRQLRSRSLISGTGRVLNLLDLNGLRAVAGI